MRIGIVGAGMAGLSCAARLAEAGAAVSLVDKGRSAGGRLSTRRAETVLGPVRFDHGAQYFTARDEAFRRQVADWRRDGVVAPWPAAGEDAWVGVPGMNALARALAARRDIALSCRVDAIAREGAGWRLAGADSGLGPFDRLAVALPAEQAAALLRPVAADMAALAAATPSDPCWTVMASFDAPLAIPGDVVKRAGPIGWAARDSAKPGRGGPESWVVQASPDWSRRHLEETPDAVLPLLLSGLGDLAGAPLPEPVHAAAHRWRYARSGTLGQDCLWDAGLRLGACGDWLLGPRVEAAWLSGRRLADAMLAG